MTTTTGGKRERGEFLAGNPFPHPYTIGFFYREKMRAIHRIAPDEAMGEILEVDGGQGGLTKLLYPDARVTNLDMDPRFAEAPVNRRDGVRFICGDATKIPFLDASFDAVTMFDVIEHVPDDAKAMSEAWRVLRPGGALLLSTPRETWRFPHYRAMARFTPHEEELFAEWGHVRRGTAKGRTAPLLALGSSPFSAAASDNASRVRFSPDPPKPPVTEPMK